MSTQHAFKSVLSFQAVTDRRLPAHYSSYHIGRLLLITGSVIILTGLLLKFLFYEDRVGPVFVLTIIICALGVGLFLFGAILVIFAARQAFNAQKLALRQETPESTPRKDTSRLRPSSDQPMTGSRKAGLFSLSRGPSSNNHHLLDIGNHRPAESDFQSIDLTGYQTIEIAGLNPQVDNTNHRVDGLQRGIARYHDGNLNSVMRVQSLPPQVRY